jgi:tRNA pseudouridine55 synthase
LIVGVGREATREFSKLVGLDKRYRAVLRLGATSDTDDRTGRITPWIMNNEQRTMNNSDRIVHSSSFIVHDSMPTESEIQATLKRFTDKIQQLPPMYSAKKIHGKKMYELARAGKIVERVPVPIEIFSIDIENYSLPPTPYPLVLDIHCSSGTYIRALARDIGEALGCGAYLEELERVAVGPFTLSKAIKIDELNKDNWEKYLLTPEQTINRCQRNKGVLGLEQS